MEKFKILVGIVPVFRNKALIVQRSAEAKYLPNQWTFVCGHVEYGETLKDAVKRELKEEVNLTCDISRIIGTNEWFWHEKNIHHIQINYLVELHSQTVKIEKSLQDFQWVNLQHDICSIDLLDNFNNEMLTQALPFIKFV